jgi:hypothetical protein
MPIILDMWEGKNEVRPGIIQNGKKAGLDDAHLSPQQEA